MCVAQKEERVQTFPCLAHIRLDRKNSHSFFACTVFLFLEINKFQKANILTHVTLTHPDTSHMTTNTPEEQTEYDEKDISNRHPPFSTNTHIQVSQRFIPHTWTFTPTLTQGNTQITDTHKSRHRNYYFNNYVFINFHTLHFALFHNNKIEKMIIIFLSHNKCQTTWEDPFPFSAVPCAVTGISSLFLSFINNINNLLSRHLPFFRVPSFLCSFLSCRLTETPEGRRKRKISSREEKEERLNTL